MIYVYTVKLPTIFHKIDEHSRLKSQKNADRMRIMILTGSDAIVRRNNERAGPYAVKAQPKNVNAVILNCLFQAIYHYLEVENNS